MLQRRWGRFTSFCALALIAAPAAATAQTTVEASVTSAGVDANRDCQDPAISPDGRYVVFTTNAALDPADTNGVNDVYWHDLDTGETRLVSVASDGTLADLRSLSPRVSRDGAFVVFESLATTFDPADTNGVPDIYLHEIATGTTTLVSVASDGKVGNKVSSEPAISADATVVLFTSSATNLVANDTNAKDDIFLRDLASGVTERISLGSSGAQGNGQSTSAAISGDLNLVVFLSQASNLVSGDHNVRPDVFVRDRAAGTTVRVNLAADGSEADSDSATPTISADGRFVAFDSFADNLVPFDTNSMHDIFLVELATGAIERVSIASDGSEGNGHSTLPSLSADGGFVCFSSTASNLVPGDDNDSTDTFIRNRTISITSWMSLGDHDQTGPYQSYSGATCEDGSRAVFSSAVPNLVPNDTDTKFDVFVRTRNTTPASWSNYGSGLAGTLGVPTLDASAPPVLNSSFDLRVGDSSSWFTVAVLVVGTSQADLPTWGGELLVDPLLMVPVALYPGSTTFSQKVPPDELLAGDVVYVQALELDAGALHGVSLSPGLSLTYGF